MKWPAKQIEMFCVSCRRVRVAELRRGTHRLYGADVDNVLVYQCAECRAVLSVPAISTGRVQAASSEQRPPKVREFRFPLEAEDLALATNAALGALPSGEPYALPLRIGLSVAHDYVSPSQDWKAIDGFPAPLRGRPLLSDLTIERIDALAKIWGESRAQVARWLLV